MKVFIVDALRMEIDFSLISIKLQKLIGMEIPRFAEVYDINSDGTEKKINRRGRKRKHNLRTTYKV